MGELILYQSDDGRTRIECRFEGETVWLTQALIAELFQTTPQNITQRLREIYAEGEIDRAATCRPLLQVRFEETGLGKVVALVLTKPRNEEATSDNESGEASTEEVRAAS